MNTDTVSTRTKSTPRPKMSVAEYITHQINLCGKTQAMVAKESGFPQANIISMLKNGTTKVPLSKVSAIAKSIGVDPMYLFRMVMAEYQPELWSAIESLVMSQGVFTQNEMDIIKVVRESGVENPAIKTDEDREILKSAINRLRPS